MNRDEVKSLFKLIGYSFNDFNPQDKEMVDWWAEALKDTKFIDSKTKLLAYVRNPNNKFAPKIGDLITEKMTNVPAAAAYKYFDE